MKNKLLSSTATSPTFEIQRIGKKVVFLSVRDLAERHRCSVATVWNRAGKGRHAISDFPKPVKMGSLTRWRLSDIEAWEKSREDAA